MIILLFDSRRQPKGQHKSTVSGKSWLRQTAAEGNDSARLNGYCRGRMPRAYLAFRRIRVWRRI